MTGREELEKFLDRWAELTDTTTTATPYAALERVVRTPVFGGYSYVPDEGTPDHAALLKIASSVATLWINSPKFRRRASRRYILNAIREFLPQDVITPGYGSGFKGIVFLWCRWGWAEQVFSNRARHLKGGGGVGNKTADWVCVVDTTATVVGVAQCQAPHLFEKGAMHGMSRTDLGDTIGLGCTASRALFSYVLSRGDYVENTHRVNGTQTRYLHYKGNSK